MTNPTSLRHSQNLSDLVFTILLKNIKILHGLLMNVGKGDVFNRSNSKRALIGILFISFGPTIGYTIKTYPYSSISLGCLVSAVLLAFILFAGHGERDSIESAQLILKRFGTKRVWITLLAMIVFFIILQFAFYAVLTGPTFLVKK
jgi:hypothetical protein